MYLGGLMCRRFCGGLLLLWWFWLLPFQCLATEMSHQERYTALLNYSAQAESLAGRLEFKLAKSEAKCETLEVTVLRLEDFVAKSKESHEKELNRVAKINRRHWRQRIIWQGVAALFGCKIIKDSTK